MNKRLLSLAAAAAFCILATPGPGVQAAAGKVPLLKAESSNIVDVRSREHRRAGRHFSRHRSVRRYHRPRHVYRSHRRYRHGWRHRGPRVVIYRGYRGCAWLRHRALVTGSRYWWRRYRWCRGW